jgi:replicative superfamily II helicase
MLLLLNSEDSELRNYREELILKLEESKGTRHETEVSNRISQCLFSVDLTMYSGIKNLNSLIYNAFSISHLDDKVSLHPEQIEIINQVRENDGIILSAPTSFGKTFCIFEYIAREKPKCVVLVVPTLALVDEYNKKIIKRYKKSFEDYKVYLNINEDYDYDFSLNNIFILTHDRVVDRINYSIFDEIDLLVIDEVYKLKRDDFDDRVLILNLAYYHLVQKAKKHILLAPFIGGIENIDVLEKKPKFIKSDYSPVVNKIETYNIDIDESITRFNKTIEIIGELPADEKKMIYFPSVHNIYSFIKSQTNNEISHPVSMDMISFIKWIKKEIHPEWYLVKSMELGYLIHNGQLPVGIRMFQLDYYNQEDSGYNTLLCTSTLLEGVNTTAKHIIITKPSRRPNENFDAFDFFNLVGRSGRLFQHYLGIAHYIKSPTDPIYNRNDAIKNIELEITENSIDIDIHLNNYTQNEDYLKFLDELNITHEIYLEKIGSKFRFSTVLQLYLQYLKHKEELLTELKNLSENDVRGRLYLIRIFLKIFLNSQVYLDANIINQLLNKKKLSIKTIVDSVKKYYGSYELDYIITHTLKLKSSYIEYEFYSKVLIVHFFLECEKIDLSLINIIDDKIKHSIDYLYYTNSRSRKLLKDLGIYEGDIEKIIKIIGDDFTDTFDLRLLLINNIKNFKGLSIVSKYIIKSFI